MLSKDPLTSLKGFNIFNVSTPKDLKRMRSLPLILSYLSSCDFLVNNKLRYDGV